MHDLHVVQFVIQSEGTEALGTGGNESVYTAVSKLLLVVRLEFLEYLGQSLPLLVVAAALEEVTAEVGDILVHLLEQGEGRGRGLAEVHRALVDVAEDHLLVDVVDATWVVPDIGV